jgi:condensin complex subunit 3
MALNSFQLFMSQVQTAPELLKLRVLQILFDVLMVHDRDFLGANSANVSIYTDCFCAFGRSADASIAQAETIINFLLKRLNEEESEKVQALICVGLSKLMLSGMIAEDRVRAGLPLPALPPEGLNE